MLFGFAYCLNLSLTISFCRPDFVNAYIDYIFNSSVAPLFNAFYDGFHKVCGGKVLELFQPNELQAMVIGNTNYDWKELEKVWKYFRIFSSKTHKNELRGMYSLL